MKIALGAAEGLAFLHEGTERPLIYRDFKSSNILLDLVRLMYHINILAFKNLLHIYMQKLWFGRTTTLSFLISDLLKLVQ